MSARSEPTPAPLRIAGSSFTVVSNGYGEGPSQPLSRYLIEHGAQRVVSVVHPLLAQEPSEHRIESIQDGFVTTRVRRRPHRPPWTYALDPVSPVVLPPSDVLFGFNCVASAHGLVHRRSGRIRRVVHWNVDFVPDRFGSGPLTKVYDRLDEFCCRHADARVELSEAARDGRAQRYGLGTDVPVGVIPMGAWIADAPKANPSNLKAPRVVFLGHLVERMGVELLVDAMVLLKQSGAVIAADIIGGGELAADLQLRVAREHLDEAITIHGFVDDFSDIRTILSEAVVAVAPYRPDPTSFTRFADPGKLKAYLGAGLPILLTDVPPNSAELVAEGGAEIVTFDAATLADRILALVRSPPVWSERQQAALSYADRFDWNRLFDEGLTALGITS